jgi:hypothetical protein
MKTEQRNPLKLFIKGGRRRKRRGEFDESALYSHMENHNETTLSN